MSVPLWTVGEICKATGCQCDGDDGSEVGGVSIDTRTIRSGDLFVALKDKRDGHEFVPMAFEKNAAAALVSNSYARNSDDGVLLRSANPEDALTKLGGGARGRLGDASRVVAVTGSAGKTSTKEMLSCALSRCGATIGAERSLNNHWGVPLSLARMPADTEYGVLEIGMNHAGEIAPLSKLSRPHVAVVTTVAPVHLEFLGSVEAIARAKAEIFQGLESGGTAVLNRDSEFFDLLSEAAGEVGARIVSFGEHESADCRIVERQSRFENSHVNATINGKSVSFVLNAPGQHLQLNALAALAAAEAVGADLERAAVGLSDFEIPPGRGERLYLTFGEGQVLVIDESYNANPASMEAALKVFNLLQDGVAGRRIAVLGDMLELGGGADDLHRALAQPIQDAGINKVFAAGPHMAQLMEALPEELKGGYAETADALEPIVLEAIKPGDVVVVKGSLGSQMGGIVQALKNELSRRVNSQIS